MSKMTRRDWLLLLLYDEGAASSHSLDPIRFQKALFYLSEDDTVASDQKYQFVPYYYGPFSQAIYRDIDGLVAEGLLEPIRVVGQTWSKYQLSTEGVQAARSLWETSSPRAKASCKSARDKVMKHTFRSLLKEVYEEYPEYATESILDKLP